MKLASGLVILGVIVVIVCYFARVGISPSQVELNPATTKLGGATASAVERMPGPGQVAVRSVADSEVGMPEPTVAKSAERPGLIRVLVIARETGQPLPEAVVTAQASGFSPQGSGIPDPAPGVNGGRATTDSMGRAEIEVSPGTAISISAYFGGADATSPVPPLGAGAVRDVQIELSTASDVTMFVRLVSAESKKQITDGVLWFDSGRSYYRDPNSDPPRGDEHDSSDEIHPNSDGLFEVHDRTWGGHFVSAQSPGNARAIFILERGHETPASALEVPLWRSASLHITVLHQETALREARVVASTRSDYLKHSTNQWGEYCTSPDPSWTVRTDATGRVEISDLPPRVPLALTVWVSKSDARQQGEPITLEPGETRTVELRLGVGATIFGSICDSTGAPITNCTLWRVLGTDSVGSIFVGYETPAAIAESDAEGRFRFEDVPVGTWLVGPKPPELGGVEVASAQSFPAVAHLVRIEPGSSLVNVALRLDRGLFLSGRVLDESGLPAPDKNIQAFRESATESAWADTTSNAKGEFTLGPLPAGSYSAYAQSGSAEQAPSDMQHVIAGDSGIVLRLRKAATIRGTVVDASHALQDGEVWITDLDDSGGVSDGLIATTQDGVFRFGTLTPGTYVLNCTTTQGLCGRTGVVNLAAGQSLDSVRILVTPGARLVVRYDGPEANAHCKVMSEGSMFGFTSVARDKSEYMVVPAAPIELLWVAVPGSTETSQKLTLGVGEQRVVVLENK